ncbi:MAG: diguanylate cyclase [Acidimicrobiia bacterium]
MPRTGRPTRGLINLLAPLVLTLVVAVAWSAWYVNNDRTTVSELARTATEAEATRLALSAVVSEARVLLELRAFDEVPEDLEQYRIAKVSDSDPAIALDDAESAGVNALAQLRSVGMSPSRDLVETLSRLPEATRDALIAGSGGALNAEAYARTIGALRDHLPSAEVESAAALAELSSPQATDPVYLSLDWQFPVALIAAMALVSMMRLRGGLAGVARFADGAARGSEATEALLGATQRIAAERNESALEQRLVLEAKELLGADAAVVYSVVEGKARAKVMLGVTGLPTATSGSGQVGKTLQAANARLERVMNDTDLPNIVAEVVLAPMINDRRVEGVLVAIKREPFDPSAVGMLQLLSQASMPLLDSVRHHAAEADKANVDGLTGLANRRRLDGDLASTLPRIMSAGQPVGFAMVDVDHFKKFNDSYGHPAGDALLRQVAKAISAAVRHRDVVYRYGGEEFCVLLPGATPSEARMVAERVRWAVETWQMVDDKGQPCGNVTVSVGVSCRDDLDTDALVAEADGALYRAKREGRNRVAFAATTPA